MLPASLILRVVSWVVPAPGRGQWIAEWLGELEHARRAAARSGQPVGRTALWLAGRSAQALPDALWLRRARGGAHRRARKARRTASPAGDSFRNGHGFGNGRWRWTLRDALRSLVRRPGFAMSVVGTLALGMASATAIFTVVDGLMLRPLPFHEPDRLVPLTGSGGGVSVDLDALREWKGQEGVFEDVRAYAPFSYVLTGAGAPSSRLAWHVEPGFLDLLGVRPLLGRDFTADDARPGNDHVVMLSHDVWRESFGSAPDVVGRGLELDGEPFTVIGVVPATLRRLPNGIVHLLIPLADPPPRDRLLALARLRNGVSIETASGHLDQVGQLLASERPREQGWEVGLGPLERGLRPAVRSGFVALGGGVLCLLLIACANAAGLLVLRGVSRRPELALRSALGGSRGSLALQMFAESMILALAAGLLGTALAWLGVRGILALIPGNLLRFSYTTVAMDGRVLGFTFALTLVTGLVAGTFPALRAATTAVARAGPAATAGRGEVRVRAVMQVAQLALAVTLLAGAGLFATSFRALLSVPPGYAADHLLELELVSLERLRGEPEATALRARELDARLRALPGVVGLSRATGAGFRFDYTVELENGAVLESGSDLLPELTVDTAYFRVMGIPIVDGRAFERDDLLPDMGSIIVDEDLAASLWPGERAVGKRLRIRDEPWLTVVGVTGDVKLEGPHDPLGPFLIFHPADDHRLRSATVLIHTAGPPEALAPLVRDVVRAVDPEQPIARLQTGREAVGETIANPRFLLVVMGVFAAVAVTLAAVGVYGLVSFTVAQKTREIGLRMALGAQRRRVVGEVVRRGLLLSVAGAALGLGAAALAGRFVESLLFGTSPLDPLALGAAVLLLLVCSSVSLVVPARNAAAVDPARSLRAE